MSTCKSVNDGGNGVQMQGVNVRTFEQTSATQADSILAPPYPTLIRLRMDSSLRWNDGMGECIACNGRLIKYPITHCY